jgi:capsular exopolysaccharide synthesis family protein
MITSSVPKEGKTFVSLCLAAMFAKYEERVLLIDGDMHRPSLYKQLDVEGDRGLSQILKGEAAFDEVVQRGVFQNMDFLPAGRYPNQTELLQIGEIEALLTSLRGRYSRIVLDSPPILAVADPRVLGRLVDRVIYLVRWDSTPRDAVRNGIKALTGAGVTIYGMALSQVNQRKHARYGYGDYGHYYGRYQDYYGG